MQIEIVNVTENQRTNKAGRAYTELEVIYKDVQGKAGTKKIMSFSNPAVFKAIQSSKTGDKVEVKTQKDDNGYWQWTGIGGDAPAPSAATAPTTKVVGSNYETKEERALRQKYIVRQSSLTTAMGILGVGAKSLDKAAVLSLASELEEWVFRADPTLSDLESDIPY
jgi:hypothetical protein